MMKLQHPYWLRTITKVAVAGFIALAAPCAPCADAQPDAMKLPDQPVSKDELSSGQWQAFSAPLEATVLPVAVNRHATGPLSFGAATSRFFTLNLYNHHQGGFEPYVFRKKYRAQATDFDAVGLSDAKVQEVAEGFFDGASVRVHQVIDGKLELIRDTKVKPGGHRLGGWVRSRSRLSAGKTENGFRMAFDRSFLPNQPYWFAVQAVDAYGQWSEMSNIVTANSPEKCDGQRGPWNTPANPRFKPLPEGGPKPPAAPANFRIAKVDDQEIEFAWDLSPSDDVIGYHVFITGVDPASHRGYGLDLADRQPRPDRPIQKGDLVFVDHYGTRMLPEMFAPYVAWPANRMLSTEFGNPLAKGIEFWSDGRDYPASWELAAHPAPVPPDLAATGGKTCLHWKVDSPELTGIYLTPHGGSAKESNYYTPMTPGKYTVEAWVRGSGRAYVAFSGPLAHPGTPLPFGQKAPASNPLGVAPAEFPIGDTWQKVTASFTVTGVNESRLGHMVLAYQGPGEMWIDNLRVYRDGIPYAAYQPPYLDHIRDSGMRFSRDHDGIRTKWGVALDQMIQEAGASTLAKNGWRSITSSYHSHLTNLRLAGAKTSPWMQVEMTLDESEWLGLVEWLCAPYDPAKGDTPETKPYAHRRWALGQERPWIDEFKEIAFEISNETWNQTFEPFDWDWGGVPLIDGKDGRAYSFGAQYGLFQEYVIGVLRSSPYWSKEVEDKILFVLGGWTAAPAFGAEAAKHSPSSELLTYANYLHNGGLGDPADMNDFKRFYLMQWPLSGIDQQVGSMMNTERHLRAQGIDIPSGIYEYGFAYNHRGDAVSEADNRFARALPFGVALLDATMRGMQHGLRDQTFFTFAPSIRIYGTHTVPRFGGHAYPGWKGLEIFNRYGVGTLLKTEFASMPRWDFPAYTTMDNTKEVKRPALPGAPLVSVYATVDEERVSVFLISRKLDNFPVAGDDGFTPATVRLPFAKAKAITLHKMAGDPRVDDRFEEHIKVETIQLPSAAFDGVLAVNAATGADDRGLPPASIFCYVFEGVKLDAVSIPPLAAFDLPERVIAGEPVVFRNTSAVADKTKTSCQWALGSLGESKEWEPTATFTEARTEDIDLKVVEENGLENTIIRKQLPVGVRFMDRAWWPWPDDPRRKSITARLDGEKLLVTGSSPLNSSGRCSGLLHTEPVHGRDFSFTAEVAAVTAVKVGDPANVGGIVLASNPRTGLGFSLDFFNPVDIHASLLIGEDGTLRTLVGSSDKLKELLPPGTVRLPARLRLAVKNGRCVPAIEQDGSWREFPSVEVPQDIGLMPALAVGANRTETTAAFNSVTISD